MASYEPSSSFHDAASFLSNASSLASVSNTVKLELYGLFKYITVSHTPNTSRPSLFDFTGRAKWDAWNSTGSTYGDRDIDAEKRYLDIAKELGWKEGDTTQPEISESNQGPEDIWDNDSETTTRTKGGAGMGNTVSTMTIETEEARQAGSLHDLAVHGDVQGLEEGLRRNPDVDLNESDEYGYTPLHLASDRGHTEFVKALLARGADKTVKDPDDYTAAELAQIAEHEDVVALLQAEG